MLNFQFLRIREETWRHRFLFELCPRNCLFTHRLSIMKSTKIDRKSPFSWFGVNFHEAFTKPDVAPGVISLRLHRGGNDRVDSNDGGNKRGATLRQRFRRLAEKGALLIDGVAKSKGGGKGN